MSQLQLFIITQYGNTVYIGRAVLETSLGGGSSIAHKDHAPSLAYYVGVVISVAYCTHSRVVNRARELKPASTLDVFCTKASERGGARALHAQTHAECRGFESRLRHIFMTVLGELHCVLLWESLVFVYFV